MNKAQHILKAGDTSGDSDILWVGTYHKGQPYLWWRNTTDTVENICKMFARLKLDKNIQGTIGEAITFKQGGGEIKVLDVPNAKGIYIEAEKRPMFNFFMMLNGVKESEQLEGFEQEFQKQMKEYSCIT